MITPMRATVVILCLGHAIAAPPLRAQEAAQSEREAMYYSYDDWAWLHLKGGSIQPHWMADGSSFWFAEGAPANTVIWKVDPDANTKTPLFDTRRLRESLTPLLGREPPHQGLPFDGFTFVDGERAVEFTVEAVDFILQLDTYEIDRVPARSAAGKSRFVPRIARKENWAGAEIDVMEVPSPDRRWFAGHRDHDLWLRSTDDSSSVQITTDGIEDYQWDVRGARWSPNSLKLALKKVDKRRVSSIPIIRWLGRAQEVEWVRTAKPGESPPQTELFIVDIHSKRAVRVDTGEEPGQLIHILGWRPDGSESLFLRLDRESKKLDLMAANPTTGATRIILTETQKTFVMGWEFLFADQMDQMDQLGVFTWLSDGKRFIWPSERDGWKHLYLYDLDGNLIRRLTRGTFPVLRVVAVDEEAGWVYFTAHAEDRLYDTHLYRVNLQGEGFRRLTEATGQHDGVWWGPRPSPIQFAPSKEFFLDTHSSTDRPPAVELRRADGTLLQTLSKANIDALEAELQWKPPEEFVVKAADGKTDLYGVLYKPYDFDPTKQYPVIESIYAGPWITAVPRAFIENWLAFPSAQALAQLGFIAFVVDGRGTPERGKQFQDVVYRNIGRYEIPDHVAALKQLGAERPYMDLSRVGVYGGSGGGYSTIRALLQAPDVYHVGIAINSDMERDDHSVDEEFYMGLPENNEEGYEYASNIRLVDNLEGKLLLIQSTGDQHGTFAWAMKFIDALIQAGKPYDLLVLPDQGHIPWGMINYMEEAIRRYFQEHLKPGGER